MAVHVKAHMEGMPIAITAILLAGLGLSGWCVAEALEVDWHGLRDLVLAGALTAFAAALHFAFVGHVYWRASWARYAAWGAAGLAVAWGLLALAGMAIPFAEGTIAVLGGVAILLAWWVTPWRDTSAKAGYLLLAFGWGVVWWSLWSDLGLSASATAALAGAGFAAGSLLVAVTGWNKTQGVREAQEAPKDLTRPGYLK